MRASPRPAIEGQLPQLVEALKGELAGVDGFEATRAEPAVGCGGVSAMCLEAIRDATRRGLARLMSMPEVTRYWPDLAMARHKATERIPTRTNDQFRRQQKNRCTR